METHMSDDRVRLLASKKEAAAMLGLSVRTIENYIRFKQLACRKIGRRTLVPVAAITRFAASDHASPTL
jgi:excisionase family DNA binding protein